MAINDEIVSRIISGIDNLPRKSEIDTPTNNIDLDATEEVSGLMSAEDKKKLNKIDPEAKKYELPVASDTLGGVKTTSDITDVSEYLPTPIVEGIPYYKPYTLPIASSSTLGGIKAGSGVNISTDGTLTIKSIDSGNFNGILAVEKGGTGSSTAEDARKTLNILQTVTVGNLNYGTIVSGNGYFHALTMKNASSNNIATLKLALFTEIASFILDIFITIGESTKSLPIISLDVPLTDSVFSVLDKLYIVTNASIAGGDIELWYKDKSSPCKITVLQASSGYISKSDGYDCVKISASPNGASDIIGDTLPDVYKLTDLSCISRIATQTREGYLSAEDKIKIDQISTQISTEIEALSNTLIPKIESAYNSIVLASPKTDKDEQTDYSDLTTTTVYTFRKGNNTTTQIELPNTIREYKLASSTNNGLMSSSDKSTFDTIASSYAGSTTAGGSANSAVKLDTSAGSATQPVYFSNGKPVATTYKLEKSVPADALFTDTTYDDVNDSEHGLMIPDDKSKLDYTNVAFCTCTTAAATAEKVVTPVGNTNWQLKPGATIMVLGTYDNTANASKLNVNDTGAKSILYDGEVVTTNWLSIRANAIMTYVYDGTNYRYVARSWDNDTYDRLRHIGSIKCNDATAIGNGEIVVANDGLYYPLRTGTTFDISQPILYCGTTAVNATNSWSYISFHFTVTTTQDITLTAYKPVFIKGTLSGKMFTPISTTPLTQEIPTTDDGYQYILLGNASGTSTIYLLPEHPIFEYKNEKFGLIGRHAESADKAIQDSTGQQIDATYIKSISVSGKTLTYTKGDNTINTINMEISTSDINVTNTLNNESKAYLTGTTNSASNTGTQVFDDGVYITTTAGQLNAKTYKIAEKVTMQYNDTDECIDFVFA